MSFGGTVGPRGTVSLKVIRRGKGAFRRRLADLVQDFLRIFGW